MKRVLILSAVLLVGFGAAGFANGIQESVIGSPQPLTPLGTSSIARNMVLMSLQSLSR